MQWAWQNFLAIPAILSTVSGVVDVMSHALDTVRLQYTVVVVTAKKCEQTGN